jgi:hypothetical protein
MAKMLRWSAGNTHGCCNMCARNAKTENKPSRKERRIARAREKSRWKRETTAD